MEFTDEELLRKAYFERPDDELVKELAKRLESALEEIENFEKDEE